jgi:hypothetical protein
MAGSLGREFGPSQSDRTPELLRHKEQLVVSLVLFSALTMAQAGVLDEFRELTGDSVVWDRGGQFWRKRTQRDLAGTRQAD